MERSRPAFVALGLLVACALAGCSSEDPVPRVAPSSPMSVSTSESGSASPSATVKPVMPAAAKKHTAAGAEAFVRFWFLAFSYSMTTGDTDVVASVSAPTCVSCRALIKKVNGIYGDGGRLRTDGWHVEVASMPRDSGRDSWTMLLRVRQDQRVLFNESDEVVDRTPIAKVPMRAGLEKVPGGWSIDTLEILG